MTKTKKNKLWFTRKGHHRNATVVYIEQNLFQQSKASRTINLNAHYLILFQSPRDKIQIKVLSNQLHAFNDTTSKPHGYLLVDLKPNTPNFILRGDLFYVLPCVILSLCFSIAITSLGEES